MDNKYSYNAAESNITTENAEKVSLYDMMYEEAREAIIDCLADGYTGYYCDLHNEVFNTTYYHGLEINSESDKRTAKELLNESVYDAIGRIYKYEMENFGEVGTDFSNPSHIINMLYYVVGYDFMYNIHGDNKEFYDILIDNWDDIASDYVNQKLINAIKS